MQPILNIHTWVSLPAEVRHKIRAIFNIPRSSNVVVDDGQLSTDGTTPEDFRVLTVEKMREYLQSDLDDFHKLFELVLTKVKDEIKNPKIAVETTSTSSVIPSVLSSGEIINAKPPKNVKTKTGKQTKEGDSK